MKSILISIIFYDNFKEVSGFLQTLEQQENSDKIIVGISVNKDTDAISEQLTSNILEIYVFYPPENLGYLNGLLFSYEALTKKDRNYDWVVFCNTDISLIQTNFFKLLSQKDYEDEIYCIAPSIFEPQRKVYENPQYKKRYTRKKLNRIIYIYKYPVLSFFHDFLYKIKSNINRKSKEESQYIYSAHGSFFILRKAFLKNLDKKYMSLMYSEEAFIAEEIRLMGKKIYYDNQLEVIHNESRVTGLLKKSVKSQYISESSIKIRDTYFKEEE